MRILIFSKSISARLEYAAQLMLQHILGVEVVFTNDSAEFGKSEEIKINYSHESFAKSLHIYPSTLLFEKQINSEVPEVSHWHGMPVLFQNSFSTEIPFDPFASAFWIAVRYEEYQSFEPDLHGRFSAGLSLAYREEFLNMPVVHLWADALKKLLTKWFPHFQPETRKFNSLSTIDVDNAWAYVHKGFVRTTGAIAKDIFAGRFNRVSQRLKAIRGIINDPFDRYSDIAEFHHSLNIIPQWFFLVGDYGKYDRNINPANKYFQNLIKELSYTSDIGLHPSYSSGKSIEILEKEKSRLETILKRPVKRSRQHFLRLTFPETYRRLIRAGIQEDYSMGYNDQPGFRAGMCLPYPWFDLLSNKQEELVIVPFQVMDRTFTEYLHLSAEQSYAKIREIIDNTAEVNGQFVSIWHNEPADLTDPTGWIDLYKKVNRYILSALQA